MATGGREDASEMDASVLAGSEAVFEHACQPCSDDGRIREAAGFCVDCADWLCEGCFRVHTVPKPAKHHVLKDLKQLNKSSSLLKPSGKCTEKCDQHSGKRLKYYCSAHEFLGCSLCVIQGHKSCKVDHIPDICESANVKKEFSKVTAQLDAVARKSVDVRNEMKENEKLVEANAKDTINAFLGYIKKLKDSLDDAGAALKETCEKHAKEEISKFKNVATLCEDVQKESQCMKTRLENLQNTGQHCNVFVALKQSKGSLATLDNKQKDAMRSSSATTYTFKPNIAVETTITGAEGIGTLVEQNSVKNKDYSNVKARHVTNISVKLSGESMCKIAGSTLLSPEKLVLTDYSNYQVKVIDTMTNEVISNYKVDGSPWGICRTSGDSVVVTDFNKDMLLFLSVNAKGNISLVKTMSVNGQCGGVAVMDDKMVVTYIKPCKLEIMDTSGTVLKTITDPQIVDYPYYVAASPDNQSVYVSNHGNHTVTCMKLDGTLVATYKDDELYGPEQIAIDSNGMIYVGGRASNNVHLVTPDCKKVKVILDESDGLKDVLTVSYCDQSDKLYIGMFYTNVIKVFQMRFMEK